MEMLFQVMSTPLAQAVAGVYLFLLLYKFIIIYPDFTFIAFVRWERGDFKELQGDRTDRQAIVLAARLLRLGAYSYLILMLPIILAKERFDFFVKRTPRELWKFAIASEAV